MDGSSGSVGDVERIGERYRVEGVLGSGGMGAVYRVVDDRSGEALALKRLHKLERHRNPQQIEALFQREYRVLSQLIHPSVIRVFEFGHDQDGHPFYTMELLQGVDLHERGVVPWRTLCQYALDVASCLALLHSRKLVHRDVSTRNVRCLGERAKLLDFGAMTPMGPAGQIVGTPPLVAPEALYREALDGRCDVYALGATMYVALTGRHAFPARQLSQLPELWAHPPVAPSVLVPDVPPELDALVLAMLAQQREARPRTAAEVMQRLSAIAGLSNDEHAHVTHAYLTTPALRGRKRVLSDIATCFAGRGEPSTVLWVVGEAGVGRSRILEAASVEARLSGTRVLKADATARGVESLARALLLSASEEGGELEASLSSAPPAAQGGDRSALIGRVRDAIRRLAWRGPLLVVVDDVDGLDAPAQGLLANLVSSTRHGLSLLLSRRAGAHIDVGLRGLMVPVHEMTLMALTASQTRALLASVFGDVPGLDTVAERLQSLSEGNPRATMELARHLVDTGRARYELGGWVLPRVLREGDLPEAWTAALDARIAGLDAEVRELAEAIAFTADHDLPVSHLHRLTGLPNETRAAAVVDRLLAEGVLRIEQGSYQLADAATRERLCALCPDDRVRALHARLASVLEAEGRDPIEVARCQLVAGQDDLAIDTLCSEISVGSRWATAPDGYAEVLEQALEACARAGRPRREEFVLVQELTYVGAHLGVANMASRYAFLIEVLKHDSGLAAYQALPASMPHDQRLHEALTAALARHGALPEQERVLAPFDAIKALTLTLRQACAFGAAAMEFDLLQALPSLEPFVSLSPALAASVKYTFPAAMHLAAGRYEEAQSCFEAVLERLLQPDKAGLDDETHHWGACALRFALGHLCAGLGQQQALEYATALEGEVVWDIAAWDVRLAYYQRFGDWHQAEECRIQVEKLRLAVTRRPAMVDTSARLQLDAAAHASDPLGARRAAERLPDLVAMHPGYAPYGHFAPAIVELLSGQHARALEHVRRALAMMEVGRHPTWPWAVSCELEALLGLGRAAEARDRALAYLDDADRAGLRIMRHHVTVPLAMAEASLGDFDSAVARIEDAIAYREQLGCRGLNLGWAYEQRARIAIWMGDQRAFAHYAELVAEEYGRGRKGSALVAKYEALRNEAQRARLGTHSLPAPAQLGQAVPTIATGTCASPEDCQAVLQQVLTRTGAVGGVLFSVSGGGLERRAEAFDGGTCEEAETLAYELVSDEVEPDTVTESDGDQTIVDPPQVARGTWMPTELGHEQEGTFVRTGVLVLRFDRTPSPLPRDWANALGAFLAPEGNRAVGH